MGAVRLSIVCSFVMLVGCASHLDAEKAKTHGAQHAPAPPPLNCKTTSVAGQLYTFCQ